jgi:hypothetical protein
MKLAHEIGRRRLVQLATCEEGVDFLLHANVGARLDLKIAPSSSIQVVVQRSFDIAAWPGDPR